MSIFEDTSNDEALARALQEELDKEVIQVAPPQPPPGTVLYSNSVLGQKPKSKRKRGTHADGLQRSGLAGFEDEDIAIQQAIAENDDAESEEGENAYFENDVFQNSEANKHLQSHDIRVDDLTVTPKGSHSSDSGDNDDDDDSHASSSDPPNQYSAKTQRRIARSEEHVAELERIRQQRAGYIRIECIRNTNAKERKMKMIPFPKTIKDLLRTANSAFKMTGKKRFTRIFASDGTQVQNTSELDMEGTNVLYFSCGEDWGLKQTVWPNKSAQTLEKEAEDNLTSEPPQSEPPHPSSSTEDATTSQPSPSTPVSGPAESLPGQNTTTVAPTDGA